MRRIRIERLTNHHTGFSPNVRVVNALDPCDNRANAGEYLVSKVEFIGFDTVNRPDIRAGAGHSVSTDRTFDKTADFVIQSKIDLPQFTVYTPFPGTPAFARLRAEGRLLTTDWSKYNGHEVVFQPKHMTPKELDDGVRAVWGRVYSYSAIFRRMLCRPFLGRPVVLLSNLNFRRFMRRVHFGVA